MYENYLLNALEVVLSQDLSDEVLEEAINDHYRFISGMALEDQ